MKIFGSTLGWFKRYKGQGILAIGGPLRHQLTLTAYFCAVSLWISAIWIESHNWGSELKIIESTNNIKNIEKQNKMSFTSQYYIFMSKQAVLHDPNTYIFIR